jgi:hypothetical protein
MGIGEVGFGRARKRPRAVSDRLDSAAEGWRPLSLPFPCRLDSVPCRRHDSGLDIGPQALNREQLIGDKADNFELGILFFPEFSRPAGKEAYSRRLR